MPHKIDETLHYSDPRGSRTICIASHPSSSTACTARPCPGQPASARTSNRAGTSRGILDWNTSDRGHECCTSLHNDNTSAAIRNIPRTALKRADLPWCAWGTTSPASHRPRRGLSGAQSKRCTEEHRGPRSYPCNLSRDNREFSCTTCRPRQ